MFKYHKCSETISLLMPVPAAPKINVPPRFREVSAYEKGEEVVIKIPFTGNPKPTVKWLRDNVEVTGHKYHVDVTERHALLTIRSAANEDSGPWRLQLDNNLGTDSAIIKIQINGTFHSVEKIYDGLVKNYCNYLLLYNKLL